MRTLVVAWADLGVQGELEKLCPVLEEARFFYIFLSVFELSVDPALVQTGLHG